LSNAFYKKDDSIRCPLGGILTFLRKMAESVEGNLWRCDMLNVSDVRNIPGVRIGNWEDENAATGCTVIIADKGASAGVDIRGGAPGTRETDLLDPVNLVDRVHAVFISGGSAFGLDAGGGIMRYLEERGIGFDAGVTRVPIVTGAVLFDLAFGDHKIRPGNEAGYKASIASERGSFEEGNHGAGTGATVGKAKGMEYAMKGGLGSFCYESNGLLVGAVVAVNAFGNVLDPKKNEYLAGVLTDDGKRILDAEKIVLETAKNEKIEFNGNTSIGVVITNGSFDKAKCKKIAQMAHNGFARTIRPSHTQLDGDSIFAMSTGEVHADINAVGILAADAVAQAVQRAIKEAESIHGVLSFKDI